MALVKRGAVRLTTRTYPLEGINDALQAIEAGRTVGRGILLPTQG